MANNVVTVLDGVHGGPPLGAYYYAQKKQPVSLLHDAAEPRGDIDALVATRVRRQLERLGKKPPDEMMQRFFGEGSMTRVEMSPVSRAHQSDNTTMIAGQRCDAEADDEARYDDDDFEDEEEHEEEYEDDYEDDCKDAEQRDKSKEGDDGVEADTESAGRPMGQALCSMRMFEDTLTRCDANAGAGADSGEREAQGRDAGIQDEQETEKVETETGNEKEEEEDEPLVPLGHVSDDGKLRGHAPPAASRCKCIGDRDPLKHLKHNAASDVSPSDVSPSDVSPSDVSPSSQGRNRPISAPIQGSPMRVAVRETPRQGSPPRLADTTNIVDKPTYLRGKAKTGVKQTDRVARNNAFRSEWTRRPTLPNMMTSKPRKVENFALFFQQQHKKLEKHDRARRNRVRSAATVLGREDKTPSEKRRDAVRLAVRQKMLMANR